MKSVGEVMAIGRTFEEVIQKGLRMIGQGMHGFTGNRDLGFKDIEKELEEPTDMRIFSIAEALELGMTVERIYELTKIDKWFLFKLKNIISIKAGNCPSGAPCPCQNKWIQRFSDCPSCTQIRSSTDP
jgi:carbamoyl-phosphate synthase large subunit